MSSLEERAAAMQLKYNKAKRQPGENNAEEGTTAQGDEMSFIDESKVTFDDADVEGFSSLGDDDEDDDAAEEEAIQLIQSQLKEIGALKLELAKKEQESAQFDF